MAEHGFLKATVYTARGAIPIEGAAVVVTKESQEGEEILALRKTNENGETELVQIDAPNANLSETPGNTKPFTSVNMRIEYPGYYTVVVRDVQIFAGQISDQNAELIPLGENTAENSRVETFTVTPQSL